MEFTVFSQKLELDLDFASQSLSGSTTITIEPNSSELKTVRFNCRQCVVKKVKVQGLAASFRYSDPYDALRLPPSWTVNQHHIVKDKVEDRLDLSGASVEEALEITLPKGVKIQQLDGAAPPKQINGTVDGDEAVDSPLVKSTMESQASFMTIDVVIEFESKAFRDGLHFVGLTAGDERYPHVYTRNFDLPGSASCIFPCLDTLSSRHEWDISITYPRTLGDALRSRSSNSTNGDQSRSDALSKGINGDSTKQFIFPISEEDQALEMRVVCTGNLTDDIADTKDSQRKTVTFRVDQPVAARHIGIAIGPFEYVNLSEFRESDQDEKLGSHAVRVHGFCLPGRSDELRNTCMPLAAAVDFFSTSYVAYPFTNYKVCFVDDLSADIADSASMSICSNRLLIPEDILDPLYDVTRELLRGLAAQWVGILVFPRTPDDFWITVGGSFFMADHYGAQLWGKNEHRYRLKIAANKVIEHDVRKPSLFDLGHHFAAIPGWFDFMKLKAPVVLQILHQRLVKASGRNGVNRIFWRLLTNTKTEQLSDGAISTAAFFRLCEKVGHAKLDVFFNQWIYGAGYPIFLINQKFNKKKLCVEMVIKQTQSEQQGQTDLNAATGQPQVKEQVTALNLRRSAKELQNEVEPPAIQRVFNGPMTIRIHEADGTPYEHIVEIKDAVTRIEIPYNTKYKRLKRSRRQRERQAATTTTSATGENADEALLYCLGDVLQSSEEFREWRLMDWPDEEETRMAQESYEWIRVDKDFEWISRTYFVQPGYMYVSQLQQDNDVVAQIEALGWMSTQRGTPLMATFLIRTLMDSRYFHGVRTMAADLLASCGPDVGFFHLEKAFKAFYCFPDKNMTRSNDFSNRASYLIQCAIPKAMAKIRDGKGNVPFNIKQFFVDKLKFNDNSNNEYSDCYYIATLMSCLTNSLISKGQQGDEFVIGFDEDGEARWRDLEFQKMAIHEIERYRRMDEWIPSYQNIYSVTSMDCIARLMEAKAIPRKGAEFLQYSRPGNWENVRIKAFEGLAKLGLLKNSSVLGYCFLALAAEPSPYVRERLWEMIWQGLGTALFSEETQDAAPQPQLNGELVVENASTDARREVAKRTQSAANALEALRAFLAPYEGLSDIFHAALVSPTTGASDFVELLDFCDIIFKPEDRFIVRLKYPRYWRCEHLGDGKVRFYHSGRVRLTRRQPPPPEFKLPRAPTLKLLTSSQRAGSPDLKRRRESVTSDQIALPHPTIRIKQKQQDSAPPAPAPARRLSVSLSLPSASPTPPPVQRPPPSPQPSKPSLVVKLKIKSNRTVDAEQGPTPRITEMPPPSAVEAPAVQSPPAPVQPPPIAESIKVAAQPASISTTPAPPVVDITNTQPTEKKPMLKLRLSGFGKSSSPP